MQQHESVPKKEPSVVETLLSWFKDSKFDWNVAAPVYSPEQSSTAPLDEEKIEFAKSQVKLIIDHAVQQTTDRCLGQRDQACNRYDAVVADLRAKLMVAETKLVEPHESALSLQTATTLATEGTGGAPGVFPRSSANVQEQVQPQQKQQ